MTDLAPTAVHALLTPAPYIERASEPGALAGYRWDCSCGWTGKSSVLSLAREDGRGHLAWASRRR